ncbi:unnamed protein product [Allacma fusca]|uniref:Uncharacterized protein n=1 Tax=Allacma fusca TaxID=39272 RepID=A0A8J2KDE8_9HEXA|nr:unnamed protein product [Allacma fusca]
MSNAVYYIVSIVLSVIIILLRLCWCMQVRSRQRERIRAAQESSRNQGHVADPVYSIPVMVTPYPVIGNPSNGRFHPSAFEDLPPAYETVVNETTVRPTAPKYFN